MQTLMWIQFANYLYRNIPVEWRLQASFLSNWVYVCTMNMLHLGIVSYINGLHVLYEIVYSCALSWLKNSLTLKCQKSMGIFSQCNPPFQNPAYGPVNWPKNSQRTRTKLLSAVRGVNLTGVSIVSLRNEGFPTFCLCLTTGFHLGFTEKLQNSPSRRMFANSSWGNAVTAFSLSSQFYVCGRMCYKLYSGKRPGRRKAVRWRNCGPPISGLAIAQYWQYVKNARWANDLLNT